MKLGGRAAAERETLTTLGQELARKYDGRAVIVHGGGAEASAWCRRVGLEPRFVDGIRQTTPEEMEVVEMVLAGKMNSAVVRTLCSAGARAVGLSLADSRLCTGVAIGDPASNRTARPGQVDGTVLQHLLHGAFLPVVSSIGTLDDGGPCNINADDAALALSAALKAASLIFLSDIPGVTEHDEVHRALDRSAIEELTDSGVITGGMVAKTKSALNAVEHGVGAVVIGEYRREGDLEALVSGSAGTTIRAGRS